MVLYDGANNFYGRYSNIKTGGRGGLHVNFQKCIQKYLIDLSVPNFDVTDCKSPTLFKATYVIRSEI